MVPVKDLVDIAAIKLSCLLLDDAYHVTGRHVTS